MKALSYSQVISKDFLEIKLGCIFFILETNVCLKSYMFTLLRIG